MQHGNQEPNYPKLMQIYEALDGRNYKQGLKLIQQCQTKFPNSYILKALKTLALYRTDKRLEALQLVAEVTAVAHVEDAVLSPISMVLKAEENWSALTEMYVKASAAHPNSKEFAEQVFASAVRAGDYKEMQKSAQGLYKKSPETRYMLWQIGSIYTQAITESEDLTTNLQATLATKMLERLFKDGKGVQQEVLWLYIDILSAQNKHPQAIETCCSSIGEKAFSLKVDRLRTLQNLYMDSKQYKVVNALSRHLMETDDVDNWEYYVTYFESLKEVLKEGDGDKGVSVTIPFEEGAQELGCAVTFAAALEFMESLVKEEDKVTGKKRRAPYLGLMELCKLGLTWQKEADLAGLVGEAEHLQERLQQVLLSYMGLFRRKTVCALDAMSYMTMLCSLAPDPQARAKELMGTVRTQFEEMDKPDDKEGKIARLQSNITIYKFEQCLGLLDSLDAAAATATADQYMQEYQDALPLNAGQEPLERGHGDDLVVLAVLLLTYHSHRTGDASLLTRALCFLEYASGNLVYNAYFHILRALIYGKLGLCRHDIMGALDVKYIQLDTLSYLFVHSLVASGNKAKGVPTMQSVVTFHKNCQHSNPDDMASIYTYESFTKIKEFTRFRKRLGSSIMKLECGVQVLVAALQEINNPEKAMEFFSAIGKQYEVLKAMCKSDCIRSNEDLDVVDIMLPRVKGSAQYAEMHQALLPAAVLPSPAASIPRRQAQCKILMSATQIMQAMMAAAVGAGGAKKDTAAPSYQSKKSKSKKGKGKTEEAEAAPVAEPVSTPEPEAVPVLESCQVLDESLSVLQSGDLPPSVILPWRLLHGTAKACALLHALDLGQDEVSEEAANAALAEGQAAASESAEHLKAALGGTTSRGEKYDFNGAVPAFTRHLGCMLMLLSLAAKRSAWHKKYSTAKDGMRTLVQSILSMLECVQGYTKGMLAVPKGQLWTTQHHADDLFPTLPAYLEGAEQKLKVALNEGSHSFFTSCQNDISEHVTDLKHTLSLLPA